MVAYCMLQNLSDMIQASSEDLHYSDLEYNPAESENLTTDINDTNTLLQFLLDIVSGRNIEITGKRVLEDENRVVRQSDFQKTAYQLGWPYYVLCLPYLKGYCAENAGHPEKLILLHPACDDYLRQYRLLYKQNTIRECLQQLTQTSLFPTMDILRVPHSSSQFVPLSPDEIKRRNEYFMGVNKTCGYLTSSSCDDDPLFHFHSTPMGRKTTGNEIQAHASELGSLGSTDDSGSQNISRVYPDGMYDTPPPHPSSYRTSNPGRKPNTRLPVKTGHPLPPPPPSPTDVLIMDESEYLECMIENWQGLELSKLTSLVQSMENELTSTTVIPNLRHLTIRIRHARQIRDDKQTAFLRSVTAAISSETILSPTTIATHHAKHILGGPYVANPRVYELLIQERLHCSAETQRVRLGEYQHRFGFAQLPIDRLIEVFSSVERFREYTKQKPAGGFARNDLRVSQQGNQHDTTALVFAVNSRRDACITELPLYNPETSEDTSMTIVRHIKRVLHRAEELKLING